jgi:hypothetical protein
MQNHEGDIPGDNVGVPIPWNAPTALDGVADDATKELFAKIDRGIEDNKGNFLGEYYTLNNSSPAKSDMINRWVGLLVQRELKCDEGKAKAMLKQWTKTNALVAFEYRSAANRRWPKGCGTPSKKQAMEALPEAQERLFK